MPRFLILFIVIAVVITVYAVVDCALSDVRRARVLPKTVWILVILLLPVVGPLLWILIGKLPVSALNVPRDRDAEAAEMHRRRDELHEDRIQDLEEQLRLLDEEIEADRRRQAGAADGRNAGAGEDETHAPRDESDDDAPGEARSA